MDAIEYCRIRAKEIDELDAIAAVKYAKERRERGNLFNGYNPYRHALEQGDDACAKIYARDGHISALMNALIYFP